jgi:hypothetical protein
VEYEGEISELEASRVVKRAAEQQRVELVLTEEQMAALLAQWTFDPTRPALIEFKVYDKPDIALPVASCAYRGDTCCAIDLTADEDVTAQSNP